MKKNIVYFLLLAFVFTNCSKKSLDTVAEKQPQMSPAPTVEFRKNAPSAGPAPVIKIGDANTFTLPNGLAVIVSENHKLPRVAYSLTLKHEAIQEGDIAGMASITGNLLNKGTETRTKADIDQSIDFIGANFNTNAFGFFASSLSKHQDRLLEIVSDVLYNPSFPEEEFEKLKKQSLSGLTRSKNDPNFMSSNVSSALVYGKDHPYGEVQTEETINNVSVKDCKNYYNEFFKPNNAYLTIVGDIDVETAKQMATKYFGSWSRRPVKNLKYNFVEAPSNRKVAFVPRDGSVQSVINITYPIDLKPGAPDFFAATLMNSILGAGGFSARIFQNLREDKGYTYGAGSSLRSDPIVGRFSASGSFRNEVSDSAVTEFLYEFNRIRDEQVSVEELEAIKKYRTGGFARSLESPQTVARFALNRIRYNLPDNYYATYLEKLNAVTPAEIQAAAQKYIKPENAYIVIVGSKDDVAEKLMKFDGDGKIDYYDYNGNEVEMSSAEIPEGLTANDVILNYLSALGGKDKIEALNSLKVTMGMEVMGQSMTIEVMQKKPSKMAMKIGNGQMVFQEQKFDGTKAMVGQMGQNQMITEGPELEKMRKDAIPIEQLEYLSGRYELELKGIEEVEGENCYKIGVTTDAGDKSTEFYNANNGLLIREVSTQQGPGGQTISVTNDYLDYREVNGILFPYLLKVTGMMPMPAEMKVQSIEVNPDLSDDIFKIE